MISAVRRLDVGEVRSVRAQARPVDISLPAGDVDAVNRQVPRRLLAKIDRLGVAEPAGMDLAAQAAGLS
jgi:hypothetical protein